MVQSHSDTGLHVRYTMDGVHLHVPISCDSDDVLNLMFMAQIGVATGLVFTEVCNNLQMAFARFLEMATLRYTILVDFINLHSNHIEFLNNVGLNIG